MNPIIRSLCSAIAAACLCIATAGTHAAVSTETLVVFRSTALDRDTTYIAIHPDPLEPGRRYPVLYLLHGATGNYRDWTERTSITALLAGRPLIVVTPDGGEFGWYLDSPLQAQSRYESATARDLVADVDARFPTIPSRNGRAIAGLSMGGHGALTLAAKYPDTFASASSMSGILRLEAHPGKWRLDTLLGPLPESAAEWARHSAWALADRFTTPGVALLFDTGTSDSAALDDNRRLHERLTNRAIVHEYREFPGGHSWDYWRARLPEHLEFHLRTLAPDAGTTPPLAGQHIADRFQRLYMERTLAYEQENATTWSAESATTRPIVLLGSSTFHGFEADKLMPGWLVANRGISADRIGLTSRGLLHRLYCSVIDLRPRAVFIHNGTNDLGALSRTGSPTVEETAACYAEVVRRIRAAVPDAHVFIVSCHATRGEYERIAPFIAPFNEAVRRLTGEATDPMIHYVDHYTETVGPDGLLKAEFSRDGLHLNEAGYRVLARRMLEALAANGITP
ncbi:MAG: alpha/beta hydrolase-fold protein [Candidatus Sumerlaeaceae bacterium]|nr:alpha/beta hydrolase-fold protein [Candidatus Sumerlaeaceae bacterium]